MASDRTWKPGDEEINEEDEETNGIQYQNQKDAVIFAIHVSESMLEVHDHDEVDSNTKKKHRNPFSATWIALQCAYQILQSRIISNPNHMMGILLFGTEATSFHGEKISGGGFSHCYMLMDLDIPDAEGIRTMKHLLENPEMFNKLMVPCKESVSLANLLFGVNQIFTTKAANFQSRRLFIITDNDNPHENQKALKNSAITRARDLYDLGVQIDPFFISYPGGKVFDRSKFYDDIIYTSAHEDGDQPTDGTRKLKEMVTTFHSKSTPKRATFSANLEFGPNFSIGVKGYATYRHQEKARSHFVYTGGEKALIASGITTKLAEDTVKVVDKVEIKRAYKLGGDQVVFSTDEIKGMRHFGDPVIRIVGFKPQSAVRFEYNLKPAQFIYPDETEFVGSTRTFAALHKNLVACQKAGLAWCIPRKNATPFLAALWPSIGELEDGLQVIPAGFFMIQLPYADDLRQNPDLTIQRAPAPLIDSMRAVVKRLHLPKGYIPEKYPNPALQWHYSILQAMALEEDLPEHPIDHTLPKYKMIEKHVSGTVGQWGHVLDQTSSTLFQPVPTGNKRKRTKEEESSLKKSRGTGDEVMDLRLAYKMQNLSRYTVAQLKEGIQQHGIEAKGRKTELIEAIQQFFDNN